ncbi:unnamed protein product [Prorocentrum cordatum]|uniref:Uncharacterized protein n=2 Tax=Prorocentrum cordatum TaxID=2364126 RepID=A0ABN9PHG9_9DINO|nr:unnamed protein product [Polarella glacialis]
MQYRLSPAGESRSSSCLPLCSNLGGSPSVPSHRHPRRIRVELAESTPDPRRVGVEPASGAGKDSTLQDRRQQRAGRTRPPEDAASAAPSSPPGGREVRAVSARGLSDFSDFPEQHEVVLCGHGKAAEVPVTKHGQAQVNAPATTLRVAAYCRYTDFNARQGLIADIDAPPPTWNVPKTKDWVVPQQLQSKELDPQSIDKQGLLVLLEEVAT